MRMLLLLMCATSLEAFGFDLWNSNCSGARFVLVWCMLYFISHSSRVKSLTANWINVVLIAKLQGLSLELFL